MIANSARICAHSGRPHLADIRPQVFSSSLRPLEQQAADLLDKMPRHPKSDVIFASGKNGAAYQGLPKAWERIAKRAKMKGVTLHTLRHSFATTANALGYSEATIAGLLGHSHASVMSRYVHVVDDALVAAADRVAKPASFHKIAEGQRVPIGAPIACAAH